MKVYAWLIDLIHRRKNCPTGMISGWVQKVVEHHGTMQFLYQVFHFEKVTRVSQAKVETMISGDISKKCSTTCVRKILFKKSKL